MNCHFVKGDDGYRCEVCGFQTPIPDAIRRCRKPETRPTHRRRHARPGDWMKWIIATLFREKHRKKCGCEDRIAMMNAWGAVGCLRNLRTILGWLSEEGTNRGWRLAGTRIGKIGLAGLVVAAVGLSFVAMKGGKL